MPSLYDNLKRANSSYVPQFVGSEADTLKSVGDVLDNRYRQNQASLDDALITAANEEYAPGDEHIGQSIYGNLSKLRDDIASSEGNFENSTNLIRSAVRNHLSTNQARIHALRNAQEYKKHQERKLILGAEGYDFTPKFTGTVNPDGTYNRFESKLEKLLDWNAPKEKTVNDITPDLYPLLSKYNPATGQIEGGMVEENKTKIKNYLTQAFNRYKEDAGSEYNQERRVLIDKGVPKEKVDDYIFKSIADVAQEKVLNRTHQTSHNASRAFLANLFPQESTPTTGTSPGHPVINTSNDETLVDNHDTTREMTDAEFEAYQKLGGGKSNGMVGPLGTVNLGPPKVTVKGKPENEVGSYTYNYNQLIKNAPEELKQQGINSLESYKTLFNEAKKNNATHTPTTIQVAQKQAGLYNDFLNRYAGTQAAVASDDPEVKSLNEIVAGVADKMKKGDRIDIVPTVIAPQLPNKDWEGGALGFDIKVNGVSQKTGYVKFNDQVSKIANSISLVNQLSRNRGFDEGEKAGSTKENPIVLQDYAQQEAGTENIIVPAVYTHTIPVRDKRGKAKFKTTVYTGVQEYDKNGNKIGEPKNYVPMDLDQWNISAWDQFVSPKLSKLIGSGQAVNKQDLKLFADDADESEQ